MPSDHSIYRKIQLVLEIAKSARVESIADLQKVTKARNLASFHTRRFDRGKDTFITAISDKSIHNAVRLCYDLKLLRENGALTEDGREAIQRAKFENVITSRILSYLREARVEVSELNKLILKNIQSRPPMLSTSRDLWEAIEEQISYSQFSKMMNLLAQCGGAETSQKKIYLHINLRA